jgi:hypothetical protein
MAKSEKEVELINELIFLTEIADKVWKYHPKNPNRVNVEEEMDALKGEINLVEMKLKEFK